MPKIRRVQTARRTPRRPLHPAFPATATRRGLSHLESSLKYEEEVLPGEDRADFEQLLAGYYELFAPVTVEIRIFVDDLVHYEWMLRRLRSATCKFPPDLRQQWIEGSTHSYDSALKYIRKIQALNQRYDVAAATIGFVLETPSDEGKDFAPRKQTVH